MKKLLIAALAALAVCAKPALATFPAYSTVQISTNTNYAPSRQNGAINVASGTVQNLTVTTATFNGPATFSAAISSATITNFTASASTSTNLNATNFVASVSTITTLNVTNAITTLSITSATITHIIGSSTNDSGTVGTVGEFLRGYSDGVTAATGVTVAVATITLTAGDWDLNGNCIFEPASTTAFAGQTCVITATSGNNVTGFVAGDTGCEPTVNNANNANSNINCMIAGLRVSVSGSTPYYLKLRPNWATATVTLGGRLSARRMR